MCWLCVSARMYMYSCVLENVYCNIWWHIQVKMKMYTAKISFTFSTARWSYIFSIKNINGGIVKAMPSNNFSSSMNKEGAATGAISPHINLQILIEIHSFHILFDSIFLSPVPLINISILSLFLPHTLLNDDTKERNKNENRHFHSKKISFFFLFSPAQMIS